MTKYVVGLSATTLGAIGCLVLFAVLAVCGTVIICDFDPSESTARPAVLPKRTQLAPPTVGSFGDSAATKEARLNAEYGEVNTEAFSEVKEGLFSRMRARRAARSASCCTPAPQPAPQTISYVSYVAPAIEYQTPPELCPTGGNLAMYWAAVHNNPQAAAVALAQLESHVNDCSQCSRVLKPQGALPTKRAPEPMPQIDPSTCDGNSCALKKQQPTFNQRNAQIWDANTPDLFGD